MMKWLFGLFVVLSVSVTATIAQETCPLNIEEIFAQVGEICEGLGRNEVCYASGNVTAQANDGVDGFSFAEIGDIVVLSDVQSLTTSTDDDSMGVVMLSVQASFPDDAPDQNITLMLFGDASLSITMTTVVTLPVTGGGINIRQQPSTSATIVGSLASGVTLQADGRLEDNSWVRVQLEDGSLGWVNTGVASVTGDVSTLAVRAADDVSIAVGGNAYYFDASREAGCGGFPAGGLVMQSPRRTTSNIVVNDLEMTIGSTILMTLVKGLTNQLDEAIAQQDYLRIMTLEGTLRSMSFVGTVSVEGLIEKLDDVFDNIFGGGGTAVNIPVDEDNMPTGDEAVVEYYTEEEADTLAPFIVALPDPIEIVKPIEIDEEIIALQGNNPVQNLTTQVVVGDWQAVEVEPNSLTTSGEGGGCTSYNSINGFGVLTISPTAGGVSVGDKEYEFSEDLGQGIAGFVNVTEGTDYRGGDTVTTEVIAMVDGDLIIGTGEYYEEYPCAYLDGEYTRNTIRTYERPTFELPTEAIEPEIFLEAVSGIWRLTEREQEAIVCPDGEEFGIDDVMPDTLAIANFNQAVWTLPDGARPERNPLDDFGMYTSARRSFETNQPNYDRVILYNDDGTLSLITAYSFVELSGDTESGETSCPDIVRISATYELESTEVPAETQAFVDAISQTNGKWQFAGAEPRTQTCEGFEVDLAGDALTWEIEILPSGVRLWFSTFSFSKLGGSLADGIIDMDTLIEQLIESALQYDTTLNEETLRATFTPEFVMGYLEWEDVDFVDLPFDPQTRTFSLAIPEQNVTYTIQGDLAGETDSRRLVVTKTSTDPNCEYTTQLSFFRSQSGTAGIPAELLPSAEVLSQFAGTWVFESAEPNELVCNGETYLAYQYSPSYTLSTTPTGFSFGYQHDFVYDPQLNAFRGQNGDTSALWTIPADQTGDTLTAYVTGEWITRRGSGDGPIQSCVAPVDMVVTFRRG